MLRTCALALTSTMLLCFACTADGDDDSTSGILTTFEGGTSPGSETTTAASATDTNPTSATDTNPTTDTDTDSDSDSDTDSDTNSDSQNYCLHQCQSDTDCWINGMGSGTTCVDNLCTGGGSGCTGDEECVALFSGWSQGMACSPGGGECAITQVCIPVEGEGHCAYTPGEFINCADLNMEEIPMADIDGNPTTVCGQPDAACHPDAYCHLPCQGDNDCLSAAYPACNVNTGLCECASDEGCASLGLSQFSVCNAGACGCGADEDCIGVAGDICNEGGACGCSDDEACAGVDNPYDGGAIECVAF